MGLLVAGKLLNVQVPFFYKYTGGCRRAHVAGAPGRPPACDNEQDACDV